MKYEIYITVHCELFSTPKFTLIKSGTATDELMAKGIASTISGINFLDCKAIVEGTFTQKVTDTTNWTLRIYDDK